MSNPVKMLEIADVATKNLTIDEGWPPSRPC